jgi:hypothetical protein
MHILKSIYDEKLLTLSIYISIHRLILKQWAGVDVKASAFLLTAFVKMQLILVFLIAFFTGLCYPPTQRGIHE